MDSADAPVRPPRRDPGYRERGERLRDFRPVELRLTEAQIREQAERCMDCGTPFCHGCGCPLTNLIPELNARIAGGRWQEALDLLMATNDFPEFTGRLCPALCEPACVLGLHEEPMSIRQVELAIVEKGFEAGYIRPRPPAARRPERVAVVGSGPAGLAAASRLNRAGFTVVVFESAARPGGILRYGIPDFKLEKTVLDRRLALMREEGIAFETGVEAGVDVSARYLLRRFDAICLAGGAREPRDLRVPGRELAGIEFAMRYLSQQNRLVSGEGIGGEAPITAHGRRVVVIGGGDTGADCLGTALRQGAQGVVQMEILPEPPRERPESAPWPEWPAVLRESSSHREGGERRWAVETRAFLGEGGRVRAVAGVEVQWAPPGAEASPAPRRKPGSEFEVPADLVLLAMGFIGPARTRLMEELGVAQEPGGRMRRDARNMTSVPGVFAAGDAALGASLVVRAIADGQRAADGIARYLDETARRESACSAQGGSGMFLPDREATT